MIYPIELLPKSYYRTIDFSKSDCNYENLVLCRLTGDSDFIEKNVDGTTIILSKYVSIETDHLRDFSTNLFGVFNQNHFGIEWLKINSVIDGMFDEWETTNEELRPIFKKHFVFTPSRSAFFLKVDDFHNISIPNDQNVQIISKVIHTPCNSNFWHFSIRWLIDDIDSSELPKSKRRSVLSIARTQISLLGQGILPDHNIISSKCYQS